VRPRMVARKLPNLVRGLPRSHSFYEPALWLAYLILTRSGVAMEKVGKARFESLLIDAAAVFENYVMTLCQEAAGRGTPFIGWNAVNGNKVPLSLFTTGREAQVEPDIYFTLSGEPVAVADVKYKPEPSRNDRYELISFCEAAQVRHAAFICPQVAGSPPLEVYGVTARGLSISLVRLDLGAQDVIEEETLFVKRLATALGALPAPAPV